jgi:hypothetical protein
MHERDDHHRVVGLHAVDLFAQLARPGDREPPPMPPPMIACVS